MADQFGYLEAETIDLESMLGEIAYLKNGNISFKCGSPNQCSQCARCSKC